MPEPVAPTAPAAPTSPPSGTQPGQPTAAPGQTPPANKVGPESDPNHHIRQMIERRGERAAKPDANKPAEGAPSSPAAATPPATSSTPAAKPPDELSGAIAKALNFRSKPSAEKKEPTATPASTPAAKPASTDPGAKPTDDPSPKTIVTRRKAGAAADPITIATQAASAAASAAVRATMPAQPAPKPTPEPTEQSLSDADRHEYEVAKFLATMDPKYKGAEKIILSNTKKAEAYAARWEQQNPGKIFNPEDAEHNEFYDSIKPPWADYEFRRAEARMEASRVDDERSRAHAEEIATLKESNARQELKPVASQFFMNVAAELAKGIGADVFDAIVKDGLPKFAEKDPVTAAAIAEELASVRQLVDTIVEVDDPEGRVRLRPDKNPAHREWAKFLLETESLYTGVDDGHGRIFATRSEYMDLSPAERLKRWYLTADQLIAEVALGTIDRAKKRIESDREKYGKFATSMGYVKPDGAGAAKTSTDATNGQPGQTAQQPSGTAKPASPSDGGSPRIDTTASGPKTPVEKTLELTSKVLFGR